MLQNEEVKILWDLKIQTHKHLAHSIPDITVVEKEQVWLIDVPIPGDSRINQKEVEKITKYQDPESRSRKTLGKEGNSCASGDRSPESNIQKSHKTSENLRV